MMHKPGIFPLLHPKLKLKKEWVSMNLIPCVRPFSCDEHRIILCDFSFQKEFESHKSKLKGGAFRLNLYPKDYFEGNPYRSDKPLPPLKKKTEKKQAVKPFKPSSPAKEVGKTKMPPCNVYLFCFKHFTHT